MSLTESMVPQSREAALEGFLLRQGSEGPLGEGCLVPTTFTPAFSKREKEEDGEGMLLESLRGTTQQVSAVQIQFTRNRADHELEEHPVFRGFRITAAYGKAHATGNHRFPAIIAAPEDTAWRRILATVQDSETRLKGAS